ERVLKQIDGIALKTPGVAHSITVSGQSVLLSANASNFGTVFITFKDFEERTDHSKSGDAIIATLRKRFKSEIHDAVVTVFPPPPVDGLGSAGGFKLMIEDQAASGFRTLQKKTDEVVRVGNKTEGLVGLFNSFRAGTPQLFVDVDREKAKSLGV